MNAFLRHHHSSIALTYRCFDRLFCNAVIPPLQGLGSVVYFLRECRQAKTLSSAYFRGISTEYHRALQEQLQQAGIPLVQPPEGVRRHDWVEPYYRQLGTRTGVAVALRCREGARVVVSQPTRGCPHLAYTWRFVNLYYLYMQDAQLGRLWVRLCPYFPFPAYVCLNGHEWLAQQLQHAGIGFRKSDNAFLACEDPHRLQQLADAFGPQHLAAAVEPILARWVPYFTAAERAQGYRHHLYVWQVEYCTNLIFQQQAALDRLFGRLLDSNRAIGTPAKLAVIFGRRRFQPDTRTARTEVKVTSSKTTVLRTGYQSTALKQYVKDHVVLRTETVCHQLQDLSIPKDVRNLSKVREVLERSNERYLEAQQDILASYVDRGQLQQLRQASVSASGRRTPGLRLDDARLLAVLQALTHFVYLIGTASFRTADLLADVRRALNQPAYRLSQLRYDLGKLRGKGLRRRLPGTQRYQLSPEGYRLAVLYQKLYHQMYAPLTAGLQEPVATDNRIPQSRKAKLDRLYEAVDQALRKLSERVGFAA